MHGGVQADRAEFMLSGVHAMRSARRSSRYSEFTLSGVQGGVQDGVHVIRSSSLQTEFNAECKPTKRSSGRSASGVHAYRTEFNAEFKPTKRSSRRSASGVQEFSLQGGRPIRRGLCGLGLLAATVLL